MDRTGKELRDAGIKTAVEHADAVQPEPKWSDLAYSFLEQYIQTRQKFMTEEVRAASEGIVPEPPSLRAWGGIVVRAANRGLIEKAGYQEVQNPKAHRTPSSVWRVMSE